MRFFKPPRLQTLSFLFSMPLIDLGVHHILFKDRLWEEWRIWVFSYPLIFLIGALSWYSHISYDHLVEKKYPGLNQSMQRILLKALVVVIIMPPSILLILFVYDRFSIFDYRWSENDMWMGLILGWCVNLIFETLYEMDYMLTKYKESVQEKESLRQLSEKQEFDTLKGQVNPHFLFNCFNTLSSLITEDRVRAEKFLDELSKVYRYLLRNNEDGLTTVQNEIRFIESYYQLLQTRHGEAVQINTEIDKRYDQYLLPSLSLQLLVENAVKHNIISKQQPVHVVIASTPPGYLTVTNNLRKKTKSSVESTGIGLANIREKYRLLNRQDVTVEETADQFIVTIPVLS